MTCVTLNKCSWIQLIANPLSLHRILKGVITNGKTRDLHHDEKRFVLNVLRDAEALDWGEDQLTKRKRAVRSVIIGRTNRDWRRDADQYGLLDDEEDEMFMRHGWNKVDSGFQLWGNSDNRINVNNRDDFLESKGWNNVDSGFRIL